MTASAMVHGGSALICFAWTFLVLAAGRGRMALLLAGSAAAAAVWAAAVALTPDAALGGIAGFFEVLRSAVWLAVLVVLCRQIGGERAAGLARNLGLLGLVLTLLAVATLHPAVLAVLTEPKLGSPVLLPRLALALLVVLVAENLYRNAPEAARWHVVLPCIALGGLGGFDLVLYGSAALTRDFSPALIDARAVLTALAAALLAIAAVRDRRSRRDLPVSREFVFHGATLMVAGTFLLGIGAASEALRQWGEPWARVAQIAVVGAAIMALAVAVSAHSVRSRLRRAVADQFFRARYDYRREWLHCIATLSLPEVEAASDVRAVRALADAVDSPAGILLLRETNEAAAASQPLRWAGGWNAPAATLQPAAETEILAALRDGDWVADPGADEMAATRAFFPALWLAVPLMHHRDGVVGVVLIARPRAPFALDGEVFDLLRMLGREVAMFLAERRGAERLAEQAQLQAYARRFAFVAHDVKTVASQLTLLLGNAATHISDPEFQQDMLLTVRASADRINTLIARLRAPVDAPPQDAWTEPLPRLRALAARRAHRVEIEVDGAPPGRIAMAPEHFDSAVTHLLDNAAEACPRDEPVRLRLGQEGHRPVLEITDHGPGMTADFVRDALFRPLATSKPRGDGIGAWQARELLRRAGGDLEVVTAPGRGTTMRLLFAPAPTDAAQKPAFADAHP